MNKNSKLQYIGLCVFLLLSNYIYANETTEKNNPDTLKPSFINIYPILSFGSLIHGEQKDTMDETLTPTPDTYSALEYGIGVSVFFIESLGIEASYIKGTIDANSDEVSEELSLYDYQNIETGMVYRYFIQKNIISSTVIDLGAGMNWTSLKLNSDLKDLQKSSALSQGYILTFTEDPATGYGYYARIGIKEYLKHFFVGASIKYTYHNVKFPGETEALDGGTLEVPIVAGISF